jgi:hypothetical protein
VKLTNTGAVLSSGDLYHYHQSRTLERVPRFDFNQEQSRATRAAIEQFLRETGAQLWIQHDYSENAKLKKRRAITIDVSATSNYRIVMSVSLRPGHMMPNHTFESARRGAPHGAPQPQR